MIMPDEASKPDLKVVSNRDPAAIFDDLAALRKASQLTVKRQTMLINVPVNYIKVALDAINAIVVADDSLVVDLVAIKRYAPVPALTIMITPLPALTAQGKTSFAAPSGILRADADAWAASLPELRTVGREQANA
jgi:endodeoxyribonuclease RusA